MRGSTAALTRALRHPRYEVTSLPGVEEQVHTWVPRDVTVTVTASPRRGLSEALDLAERLSRAGYTAVPHLAARQVVDDAQLGDILQRLRGAGIREVFVVGGDSEATLGAFPDALMLLKAMDRLGHAFERVGVAGYPEGHPRIGTDELDQAVRAKAPFASYVVTQMSFDPAAVESWVAGLRAQEVPLPVHVGLPGVVDTRKLLRVTSRIGVGASARFLSTHRRQVLRLVRPGYRPDALLRRLGPALAEESMRIAGVHLYTINDVAATERWRQRVLAKLAD